MPVEQDILVSLPNILEEANNMVGIIAAIIGGICALKGIGYLETLRQRKASATFSFEAQLYARLYELKLLLDDNERLLTNFYSEIARGEWGDKRGASKEELDCFYDCAKETLGFIKSAADQMPAYDAWVEDYAELIQFLVDVLHFDVRTFDRSFKYVEPCSMEKRKELCKSICEILDRMMAGIKKDQEKTTKDLFHQEQRTKSRTFQRNS